MKKLAIILGVSLMSLGVGCSNATVVTTTNGKDVIVYENPVYHFSFSYPRAWLLDGINNDTVTLHIPAVTSGEPYDKEILFKVTMESFAQIKERVMNETNDANDTFTQTMYQESSDTMIDGVAAKTGSYLTRVGLSKTYYFVPLTAQNNLYIEYYGTEGSTSDIDAVIQSIKL